MTLTEIRPCTTIATFNKGLLPVINAIESILIGTKPADSLIEVIKRMHACWGYQLSHCDCDGNTIVHLGARHENADFLRIIFQKCTNASEIFSIGAETSFTPLHTAVKHNKIVNAYTLISLGSPINITTMNGSTPLNIALRLKRLSIAVLLRLNGGKCASIYLGSAFALLSEVDKLIVQKQAVLQEAIGQHLTADPLNIIATYAVHLEELNS